jgi:hypothetical protein
MQHYQVCLQPSFLPMLSPIMGIGFPLQLLLDMAAEGKALA